MIIVAVLLLGGLSLYLNKDWFAKDNIHVYHRSLPPRPGFFRRRRPESPAEAAVNPVMFGLDGGKLKLTSVKVLQVSVLETNKYALPLWHLVSDSNSVPVKDFGYGMPIRGMRPAVQGSTPDPLEPNVKYRLQIEAGDFKAEDDFVTVPRTQ